MLNKNDPLVAAIQKVMQTNQAERDAVSVVNEKFGVADRRALPRERQHEWDAAYAKVLTEGVEALDEKVNMTKKQFANLDGKPGFTANDLRHARAGTHEKKAAAGTLEEKKMKDDPCWDTHEMVGMKKGKGGKPVPNCVPVKEEGDPSKAIRGDVVTGGSSVTTAPSRPTSVQPSDQSALKKKIQSVIKEAKKAAMCEDTLEEKAVSKAQQRFMGLVRGIQKGKAHGSPEAEKAAETMSAKEVKKFAGTKQKGLPEKKTVKEGFNNRHDLSVTASVEEQVVAEQTSPMPVSGVQNSSWFSRKTDMQRATQDASKVARLRAMRKKSPALDTTRDPELDKPGLRKAGVEKGFSGPKGRAREKAVDDISRETLKTVAPYAATGGPIGNLIGRGVGAAAIKGYQYLKNLSKTAPAVSKTVQTTSQAAPKTTQTAAQSSQVAAPAVSQVANKFRANVANRRYNVAGAQQRPPQSVAPATQSSVPQIAQGTGQGNRLAATRRADSGPWGGTPPAAAPGASKLRVPPGGFAANLQRARQQAQTGRAGVNTAQATQAATRAASARQSSQALGGFGKTTNATNALRAKQSSQALGGFGKTANATNALRAKQSSQALGGLSKTTNATNALRAKQSSQALGGFGRATSSLGNLVRKNPKLAAGAAAGAALTGFAATQLGNKPPSTQADTGPEKIKTSTQTTSTAGKVSDRDIMNDPRYKAAVSKVGGEKGARKIGVGKTVDPVGKFSKGETIWSKVKGQLEKERSQQQTSTSVAGGQGIAGVPGGASKMAPQPSVSKPSGAQVMTNPTQRAYDKNNPSYSGQGVASPLKKTPPKPLTGGAGR